MDRQYSQDNSMEISETARHILVIEDPSFRRTVSLDGATYSIGRHSSNDIVLSCQRTSRHHATLLRRTDVKTNHFSYWILDGDLQGNRSRNGIYINGKKCLVHELKQGDVIKFSGEAQAKYSIVPNNAQIDEQFNNINPESSNLAAQVEADSKKTVLNKETLIAISEQPVNNGSNSSLINYPSVAELSPQPIIEIDLQGNITYANSAAILKFKDLHQKSSSHPLFKDLISLCNQHNTDLLVREINIDRQTFQQNARYIPDNQTIRSYIFDLTEQKNLARQLAAKEALYQNILKQVIEGIIVVNGATKRIIEVNKACSNLLGYSTEEMLKMTIYELSFEEEKLAASLQKIVTDKSNFIGAILLRHQDGTIININTKIDLINTGESADFCIVLYRSTEHNYFSLDSLDIDLTKREVFYRQLASGISNAKRNQKLLAVMFFSLDFLLDIQETIGYEKSNRLLSSLAERLRACLRSGDTVSHWKEDKFALLMPQIDGIEEVAKISQRIQESLEQSFKIGENQFNVTSNIGIAIYPQDGIEIDSLLKNAEAALHRAQRNNNNYQFYSSAMNSQALVMLQLEELLHHALERNEFKLYYQPQINVNDGTVQGIEALLRWENPELGLVSPASFIKLAEQTGLIIPIGEWVIRTACSQNKQWQLKGAPPLRISVNISLVQFQQPSLATTIAEILAETELEPSLLELEIAASTLMEDIEYARQMLELLQHIGVHVSIDGFATGFSSFENLKQFSFNTLKIDRSFVQELTNQPQDLAVISALIELGKGFDLRVVAEGVETRQQIELLRSLDCQQMQGFWFSRPLNAEEATKLLPFDYNDESEVVESEAEAPEAEVPEPEAPAEVMIESNSESESEEE